MNTRDEFLEAAEQQRWVAGYFGGIAVEMLQAYRSNVDGDLDATAPFREPLRGPLGENYGFLAERIDFHVSKAARAARRAEVFQKAADSANDGYACLMPTTYGLGWHHTEPSTPEIDEARRLLHAAHLANPDPADVRRIVDMFTFIELLISGFSKTGAAWAARRATTRNFRRAVARRI